MGLELGSESNDWYPYKERNNWSQEQRATKGDGGKSHVVAEADCSDAPVNQGMPEVGGNQAR